MERWKGYWEDREETGLKRGGRKQPITLENKPYTIYVYTHTTHIICIFIYITHMLRELDERKDTDGLR